MDAGGARAVPLFLGASVPAASRSAACTTTNHRHRVLVNAPVSTSRCCSGVVGVAYMEGDIEKSHQGASHFLDSYMRSLARIFRSMDPTNFTPVPVAATFQPHRAAYFVICSAGGWYLSQVRSSVLHPSRGHLSGVRVGDQLRGVSMEGRPGSRTNEPGVRSGGAQTPKPKRGLTELGFG